MLRPLARFGFGAHAGERREPVFGGYEVGIGFSETGTSDSGEPEGIALASKRSLRLAASLMLMRRA